MGKDLRRLGGKGGAVAACVGSGARLSCGPATAGAEAELCAPEFMTEPTLAGPQTLVPGVVPIHPADRLAFLASAPLAPTKPQRPADFGLFDLNARLQLEMFVSAPKPSVEECTGEAQLFGAANQEHHP